MEMIRTDKQCKYYGKARGIDNLDLVVEQGDFFGFIGPNGAGKSTTIRTLLGLIAPTSGHAAIMGRDITKERERIFDEIGYLPSEATFYAGMKVKELLKFSADLRKKDCSKQAEQLCKRLKLDPERKISELSFGNRKKVGIVCALQHDPKLLILDEPTSGLDPLIQKEFFTILQERNEQGVTILISSHVLSEIQRNCTKAAIIRDGTIIACERVDELAKTNARRIVVHGTLDLTRLDGVRDVFDTGASVSFLYSGKMQDLLEVLNQGQIEDLSITEPDLEEIFLHYYQTKGEQK